LTKSTPSKANAVATSNYSRWYKDCYRNPRKRRRSNTVAARKPQRRRTSSHQTTKARIDDEDEEVTVIEEVPDEQDGEDDDEHDDEDTRDVSYQFLFSSTFLTSVTGLRTARSCREEASRWRHNDVKAQSPCFT
jgi:hypothetical protein